MAFAVVVGVLTAGADVVSGVPAAIAADGTPSVPSRPLASHPPAPRATDQTDPAWLHPTVTMPSAGSAEAAVPGSGYAQVGDLPVYVGRSANSEAAPGAVRVELFDQSTVEALGARFFAVRVQRVDGSRYEAPVSVQIDYAGVRRAFGGNVASRLRLTRVDVCALTTPNDPPCAVAEVVAGHADLPAQRYVADIVAEPDPTAAPTADPLPGIGPSVYAMSSGTAGETGDYKASPMPMAERWSVGIGSGAFTYSYPIPVPPPVGGPAPSLSLDYSSQSIDGRTNATNSQPSQVGEGWSLENGYIERRFKSCKDDGVPAQYAGNLCWAPTMEYYLHFGGRSGEIVQSATTNEWRLRDDPAWRIQSWTGASNGDNDGEYFTLYTPNGTKYWFGLGTEPRNVPTRYTNSTLNVPVFAGSGEPCYSATAGLSYCTQAWRWNLDRVQDPATNVESLFYAKETNFYRRDTTTGLVSQYDRASYPTRIEYSKRSGSEDAAAPSVVTFTVAHRCAAQSSCPAATPSNGSLFPDVPNDLMCTSSTSCPGAGQSSPSFWSTEEITRITTWVLNSGGGLSDVDTVDLAYSFPATDEDTDPSLWLRMITRTGVYGGTTTLPSVLLGGVHLPNRVDNAPSGGVPATNKYRVDRIVTETGGQTDITYGTPDPCSASAFPQWDYNTTDCFPQWFVPAGSSTGGWGGFRKYVVTQVVDSDLVAASPNRTTTYTYEDAPAWHYVNQLNVPASSQSWSDYRGYSRVKVVESGDATAETTSTRYRVYRGMNGDRLSNGNARAASITDYAGTSFTDHEYLAGRTLETDSFSLWGTWLQSDQHRYWTSQTLPGPSSTVWPSQPHSAQFVRESIAIQEVLDASPGGGSWRQHRVDSTYSSTYGVLTSAYDHGDGGADNVCRKLTYAVAHVTSTNPSAEAWILDVPYNDKTVAGTCAGTAVVANKDVFYDGSTTLGAVPTKGRVTRTDVLLDGSTGAKATTKVGYDGYNRIVSVLSPNQVAAGSTAATTTVFTPSTGFPYTDVTVTNPLGHQAITQLEPAWATPVRVTDANNNVTVLTRDSLGRITAVKRQNDSASLPSRTYAYVVAQGSPSRVNTRQLLSGSTYVDSFTYYDGFGQPIESHGVGPNGGRVVSATRYDAQGHPRLVTQPFYNSSAIGTGVVNPLESNLPVATRTTYDAMGRVASSDQLAYGAQQWQTTYDHFGTSDTVHPPAPQAAATTYTDVFGRPTRVVERPSGTTADTTYSYTRRGDLATVVDAAGNAWAYEYDEAGRRTKSVDPDRGTWSYTYDSDGNVASEKDALLATVAYAYDALDRRTSASVGTASGTRLAEWTYDTATLGKGHPATSSRVVGADRYTVSTPGYDPRGRAVGTTYSIPAIEGGLAGTYAYTFTYDAADHRRSVTLPAVGSLLAQETVTSDYSNAGYATTLTGADAYVSATGYNNQGMLVSRQIGTAAEGVARTFEYDAAYRLDRFGGVLAHAGASSTLQSEKLVHDAAGNLSSVTDYTTGQTECFRYGDGLGRLTAAFTTTAASCAGAFDGLGADPYNLAFAYDKIGNRTSVSDSGVVTVPSYAPLPKPHAMKSNGTASFGYDANGAMTSRTAAGGSWTYGWDALHALASITPATGSAATFVTDAGGNRLVRHNGDGTGTVYLDGMEITAPLTAGAAPTSATRYYGPAIRIAGGADAGLWWRLGNQQNSATITVNAATGAVRKRRFGPFGAPRGAAVVLAGSHGFLDKTEEAGGLDLLGARLYDPSTGQFTSTDPLVDPASPQTLNAYAYARNNPTSMSDPTGFEPHPNADGTWGGFGCADGQCTTSNNIENSKNHALAAQARVDSKVRTINRVLADLDAMKARDIGDYQDAARRECPQFSTWSACEVTFKIHLIEEALHPKSGWHQLFDFASTMLLLLPLVTAELAAADVALAESTAGAAGAANSANGVRLAGQLTREEAAAVFTEAGALEGEVIANSTEFIVGSDLGNKSLIESLTADGSSIADWGKYATDPFHSPSGSFQVHFYYNSSTGSVFYDLDYKAIFTAGGV